MRRRGFSIIELVLIMGLICLVAEMTIPSLFEAYEAAQSAKCKSNLHLLAVFCQGYAMREGFYPWGSIEPNQHEAQYWGNEALKLIYPRENPRRFGVEHWNEYSSFCWDFTRRKGEDGWDCGEILRGVKARDVFGCPKCSRERTDNWDGNHVTGYNYNVCYVGYVENDAGKRKYPTAWESVKHPSRVVVFGDGGYAGGPNKFMRAPIQDKEYDASAAGLRKAGTQAFRHGRGEKRHCNMAFLDGHVEEFRQPYKAGGKPGWVDETTHSAFISSGNGIYGPRGFGVGDDDEPK